MPGPPGPTAEHLALRPTALNVAPYRTGIRIPAARQAVADDF